MLDKYTKGFIAGTIAGIISSGNELLLVKGLKFGTSIYWDYAGRLTLGRMPKSIKEIVFSQIIQLFFSGVIGMGFTFYLSKVSRHYLLFKGIVYSWFVWFLTYAFFIIFKITPLDLVKFEDSVGDLISAIVFGIVIAGVYQYLNRSESNDSSGLSEQKSLV